MVAESNPASQSITQRVLDLVERVGNKVPHPVLIFLILIAIVLVVAHVLYLAGVSVSYQVINPETHELETATTAARTLLSASGVRDMYTGLVPNLMGFSAIGLLVVAMVGVGVAEEAGLINTLIRTLVAVSPGWALTYILALVGILSSIAADAGYVVLIPLAGAAYLSLGRHPLAGIALGFAAVAGAFNVNMLIKPLDAVLTEITNDAIHMVDPTRSIDLTAGLWFSIASVPFLTVVIALITDRLISPRLGKYEGAAAEESEGASLGAKEWRGLRYAALGLLGVLVVFGLLSLPEGAPLRNPETGALIGNSPFMNGLIVPIMFVFLVSGAAYGWGAGTIKSSADVIGAMTKAVSGLGGTILLFLVISQFIAYFNYSNIPTIMAVEMADTLTRASIGPIWLLLGFIVVVTALNLVFTPAIAKWAIFAPVFVPLLVTLGVDPAAVLSAYRVGDSPTNSITPLNAYFALVVGFAQRYDKNAGIGTIVALLLPYAIGMSVLWTALFAAWYLLGLPWGF
ncbi:p-aminobenzoyl-glutamate transport protein [Pirellulimonas nuda]|uniref:p-aminobenzoyl-glutamate transport protein n=1 Tax=Pirellulimonas nuda TaxID=2528009 RepID=A0A518DFW1_9BACT|nr:AbgT family transporter [Pirellulimonas nuda]QDU90361.1 p-aminobenzoyl-glutamate transport protein [Pirellulimonas nuda]